MRKHMLPYILGYLPRLRLDVGGGIIISLSALSFLGNGLGIDPQLPPGDGRSRRAGQSYVSSVSWHISLIPGLMIVLLVTGMNALTGIRDAIDPETESGEGEEAAAGGGA